VPFLRDALPVRVEFLLVRNLFFLVTWIVAVEVRQDWRDVICLPSADGFVVKLIKINVETKPLLHVLQNVLQAILILLRLHVSQILSRIECFCRSTFSIKNLISVFFRFDTFKVFEVPVVKVKLHVIAIIFPEGLLRLHFQKIVVRGRVLDELGARPVTLRDAFIIAIF